MKRLAVYVHGKGGSAAEAGHYRSLLRGYDVIGFDYRAETPWEAQTEFPAFFGPLRGQYRTVVLIANSIGAYFAMNALSARQLDRALLISPIADMEGLILGRMARLGITQERLRAEGEIPAEDGEPLSWRYLQHAREVPTAWDVPTEILYGDRDFLTPPEAMAAFAKRIGAGLTVLAGGEHWFHTKEQMAFLDRWVEKAL